jgi:hypothetical protein
MSARFRQDPWVTQPAGVIAHDWIPRVFERAKVTIDCLPSRTKPRRQLPDRGLASLKQGAKDSEYTNDLPITPA